MVASREMCKNILSASNSIDENGIAIKKDRKFKRTSAKSMHQIQ